jgi:hypothetical protein
MRHEGVAKRQHAAFVGVHALILSRTLAVARPAPQARGLSPFQTNRTGTTELRHDGRRADPPAGEDRTHLAWRDGDYWSMM